MDSRVQSSGILPGAALRESFEPAYISCMVEEAQRNRDVLLPRPSKVTANYVDIVIWAGVPIDFDR